MSALAESLSPASASRPGTRIRGNSDMAELIRGVDWEGSALGPASEWPDALLTSLNIILSSPMATSIYWGPEHVLLYNDSYRRFMGARHPGAVGRPGREVWNEAWHIVGPQITKCGDSGETTHGHNALVPIELDGVMTDCYWNYTFSPIYDAGTGEIVGVFNTCREVTETLATERERDSLAQRLQDLLESTSESVIMIDREWRFTYLNRAAETFALPITGLVGKIIWEVLPGLVYDGSPNVYHYQRAMEHGESSEFDSFYPEPINRWRHIQVRPAADGIVLFARDITDQKRADAALKASNEALAESEEELRWTVALTSQYPWTADADGRIVKHTEDLATLCGYSAEEILGDLWPRMMHPDDVERMKRQWSACVRTGEPYDIEHRIVTASGDTRWLRARAYPRRNAEGRIVKWYGITEDIDERKRAAAALKASNEALTESEEELRWTIALSSQMTWTADADGLILKHSGNLAALTGHSGDEVLGSAWTEMMHADDVERMRRSWSLSVRTGRPYDIEFRILNTTGGHHWFRARAFPRRDAEGHIIKWYGITDDIDERKHRAAALERTAAALAASEEELLWTVRMSTQNPWTADAEGRLLSADEGLEVTGVNKEDLLGERWIDVIHPDDAPAMAARWAHCVATGDVYEIEHRMQNAGGEHRWYRARAFARRDATGRIVKWYGTSEDIHARKQAEEALRTTEKLAAVGRLATSIAHEINNPLEAVTNLLYLARTSEALPEVLSYIKTAEQELHRASVITNQTLRFQRQSSGAVPLDSEDLIENCLAVFQGKLQNSAVIPERRLRARRPVTCYDGEIRQVFLNLVGNAIDAMQPGGGRLLIRTREAAHPATGKPGLVLTVADTGSGISEEARAKLFAPFFTTKGLNGTGLGLWVSQEIVARHQGSLRLRSKPRRRKTDHGDAGGTVFTLFLPYDFAQRHPVPTPASELHAVAA